MPRPCHDRHPDPHATAATCRLCYLHLHDDRYRRLWDGQPQAGAVPVGGPGTELKAVFAQLGVPACQACHETAAQMDAWGVAGCKAHRGEIVAGLRERAEKISWWQKRKAEVNAVISGLAFRVNWLDPFPSLVDESIRRAEAKLPQPIKTRNLLYHIYPVKGNGVWQWNVQQIVRRLHLFNGKLVVAVVTDSQTDSAAAVKAAFGAANVEILTFRNDPNKRETLTFEPLYSRVESIDPTEATFYGHAKGVTSTNWAGTAPRLWAEATYEICLDYWHVAEKMLAIHPLAGPFKRTIAGWPGESASQWHYSGSMHWFRNAELFRKDWRRIDPKWFGIESYPSLHFATEQAGCLFYEFKDPGQNTIYNAGIWAQTITPQFKRWKQQHRKPDTPPQPDVAAPDGTVLKVELGGGKTPRGGEWINVDRDDGPTVQHVVDFEIQPLPFADATVGELYSAHTLEHVRNLVVLMREIVRVCKLGAHVEIRVPAPFSSMSMCHDHKQVIPDEQVEHWCNTAVEYWFGGCERRLRHLKTTRIPGGSFEEAKKLFPHMSDDQLMRFIPNACHELQYSFEVVAQ